MLARRRLRFIRAGHGRRLVRHTVRAPRPDELPPGTTSSAYVRRPECPNCAERYTMHRGQMLPSCECWFGRTLSDLWVAGPGRLGDVLPHHTPDQTRISCWREPDYDECFGGHSALARQVWQTGITKPASIAPLLNDVARDPEAPPFLINSCVINVAGNAMNDQAYLANDWFTPMPDVARDRVLDAAGALIAGYDQAIASAYSRAWGDQ